MIESYKMRLSSTHALSLYRRRGMTFLEIMVVVVIMSVLMAISIPTLTGLHNRNKLTAATREFTTLARYARQQAILRDHGTEIRINIDKAEFQLNLAPPHGWGNRYRGSQKRDMENMEKEIHTLDPKFGRIVFEEVKTAAADTEGRRSGRYKRVLFHRNGSASPATICLADTDGRRQTIVIAAATGSVRAYKGAPRSAEVDLPEPPPIPGESE